MIKRDLIYLDHIHQNLSKVSKYLKGVTYDEFISDEQKQDAIIRKIEVVGEATKRLSLDLREKYSHIPWRAIAGMRDKLIHDYFDVDLDTIWETATKDITSLTPLIGVIIIELEKDENL